MLSSGICKIVGASDTADFLWLQIIFSRNLMTAVGEQNILCYNLYFGPERFICNVASKSVSPMYELHASGKSVCLISRHTFLFHYSF